MRCDSVKCSMFRPNHQPADSLTQTQLIHEWVDHLKREGWDIADGGRGKASFPADEDAVAAMQMVLSACTSSQSGSATMPYGSSIIGEDDYRMQAAEGLSNEYGFTIAADSVMFTTGGQFGLALSFAHIQRNLPDSVLITPCPWYVNHAELFNMVGAQGLLPQARNHARCWPVMLDESDGFRITAEALMAAITSAKEAGKTIAGILFCIPGNPLGNVMLRDDWHALLPVLEANPALPILLDEAFAEVIFHDEQSDETSRFRHSLLHHAPQLWPRCILFRSGTKALGMAGERLALLAAAPDTIQQLLPLQSRLVGNAPLSLQAGMAAAFGNMSDAKKTAISDHYERQMTAMRQAFSTAGLTAHHTAPQGGFYMMLNLSALKGQALPVNAALALGKEAGSPITNDYDIAFALLLGLNQPERQGVALIPGSCFGYDVNDCLLRVSFSSTAEEVAAVTHRILQAMSGSETNRPPAETPLLY